MKTKIIIPLFFFYLINITGNVAKAQWVEQNSGTTNDLFGVYFTDANHGVAVGLNGIILRTINGGQLWQNASSPTSNHLVTVCFPSPGVGYAAGFGGTIVKSVNGGNNWTLLNSGTLSYINSLHFFNDTAGFAAGENDLIIYTNDGGNTWTPRTNGTNSNQNIYKLSFVSPQIGYAAISENPYHGVLKTTDGGNSWLKDTLGFNMPFSVCFIDANTGFAVGSFNHIWKTVNGGQKWTATDSSNGGCYYDVFFSNPATGYIIGDQGMIKKTTNVGSNWQQETTNTISSLRSIYFTDALNGYAVGLNGTILKKGLNTSAPDIENADSKILIYPNPASDNITVEVNQKALIEILNLQGQLIKSLESEETQTTINISDIEKGMYFIKIQTNNAFTVKKFVKG